MQLNTPITFKVFARFALALIITGCDQTALETKNPQSSPLTQTDKVAIPPKTVMGQPGTNGNVRQAFVADKRALLESGAVISVLAASNKILRPMVIVKGLGSPKALIFPPQGKLYFLTNDTKEFAPDWIGAIAPELKTYSVIALAPQSGYVQSDEYGRVENYMPLTWLSYLPGDKLLTIAFDQDPFLVNPKAEEIHERMRSIPYLLPSGKKIEGILANDSSHLSGPKSWEFSHIQADKEGRIVVYNGAIRKWQRFKPGGKIEEIANVLELPMLAYLVESNPWEDVYSLTIGSDGYIYAVEEGKDKEETDRVIRIGDPGLSSLRNDASRVTIAKFRHGELTGALAFSPKGELAVGAQNAIYLITPRPIKKPQFGKVP